MADYSPHAAVNIDGTDLNDDQQAELERVTVDLHLHLPGMFALTFDDTDEDNPILDDIGVAIGSTVEVSAVPSDGGAPEKLISGEVTALEGDYGHWGRRVIVRGYDMTHRLHRGRVTETYQNVTTSDVVQQVVNRAGLQIGQIDSTSVTHDQVSQPNLSDWDFLKALSRETGYEMVVDEDGKFYFRQPVDASTGPTPGTYQSQ
ncbi:MAG: type IV secretion protein Rhs, partial [Chloroflexi bacterium]